MVSSILRGPGSLGLLSSQRAGRKRTIMNPHNARIKRISSQGVEIGINLFPVSLILIIDYIIVSSAIVKGFCPRMLFVPSNSRDA